MGSSSGQWPSKGKCCCPGLPIKPGGNLGSFPEKHLCLRGSGREEAKGETGNPNAAFALFFCKSDEGRGPIPHSGIKVLSLPLRPKSRQRILHL